MCGICGKMIFKNKVPERSLINAMCYTLDHRGPDDMGIYITSHIGLGQTRLSIIDLSKEATAPIPNEVDTIWVVFNGEIYNFQDLRAELIKLGHHFRTKTDTEVIVHLYEEYGTDCLMYMRGMFAFALWDAKKKQLFAARDRLGKKPFCYVKTPRIFVFGSEIKAITADPEISISPNFQAIDRYLTYSYVPSPLTAFDGIYKLPPGHYLNCNVDGRFEVHKYWSPPLVKKTKVSKYQIQEEFFRLLQESVKLRMISDVPLGAFLSGGIDSGTIVALMAQESTQPVKTFSIGFEEDSYNELPYAKLVAKRYKTDHHEFIIKPDATEVLPVLIKHYNEPFADSSALSTYYVSQFTRQHVTVALSGDGGDESFAGYNRYRKVLGWGKFDKIPFPMKYKLMRFIEKVIDILPYHNMTARISRGLTMLYSNLPARYLLEMTMVKPQEKRIAYSQNFKKQLANKNGFLDPVAIYPWEENMDILDWMMRHDQSFYLPDDLMVKTDITSMANSLEVRCPFLDHNLVEYAAMIPSSMKHDYKGGKLILKTVVNDLLPYEIINKPKKGFSIPLARWFRKDLADMLRGMLLDDCALKRNLFNPGFLKKIVGEQINGQRDWSNRLWAFLFLEMWFREFID